MSKFLAILEVLHEGSSVANPAKWKKGQIYGSHIIVVLSGLAMVFNQDVPKDVIAGAATVILWIGNIVFTVATSKTVGLQPKP